MATRSQETATAKVFLNVPRILFVPGADPVIVVDFPKVKVSQQALIDARAYQIEVLAIAGLKTDAGADTCLADRLACFLGILVGETNRLFDDQVFSCLGRGNGLICM